MIRGFAACAVFVLLVLDPAVADPWSMDGGTLRLSLDRFSLDRFGLDADSPEKAGPGEMIGLTVELGRQGAIEFDAPAGRFEKLLGGSLPLRSVALSTAGVDLSKLALRLVPAPDTSPPALRVVSADGREWLTMDYGHFELTGDTLDVHVMDLKLGRDLARAVGHPHLAGQLLGSADLRSRVAVPEDIGFAKGACDTPVWPTVGGGADIAMIDLPNVFETSPGAVAGRVIITPSATFSNVGSSDVPWFNMFALPATDPNFCFDDGAGACQPYSTDQGGKLVWNFYRYLDGRLEQLGRSAMKHAFNSQNSGCACNSGRIVWQGCDDFYSASTNAHRDFLGPRSELTAHSGQWDHRGSIFDADGNDQCDNGGIGFSGGMRCASMPADDLEYRLHVAEADLADPGARYFVETWYVVRDDVDILNSMGHREVDPTFSTIWTFPFQTSFTQGPAVDEFLDLQETFVASQEDTEDTGEGRFRATTTVTDLGGGQRQFDIALMNFDFDRAIEQFDIPYPDGVTVAALQAFDGDGDAGNDWTTSTSNNLITFKAPDGTALTWGTLISFRFQIDSEAVPVEATVTVDAAGSPSSYTVTTLTGVDRLFHDGFESPL